MTGTDKTTLDILHATHGHIGPARMRHLLLALPLNDARRAALPSLSTWEKTMCPACMSGKMIRPNQRTVHPDRVPDWQTTKPGELVYIDHMGIHSPDKPTLDGTKHTFVFTDGYSRYRMTYSCHDKTASTLLKCIIDWQSRSGILLRHIHTDQEFMCDIISSWCLSNCVNNGPGTRMSASSPNVHQQNGASEAAVGAVKSVYRTNRNHAGTMDSLLPWGWRATCIQHNRSPCKANPNNATPASMWPSAPFNNPRLVIAPWGCLVSGGDSNNRWSGIFLHHRAINNDYAVYHASTNTVTYRPVVEINNNVFPLKRNLEAGEVPGSLLVAPTDGPGSWRQHGHGKHSTIDDGPYAEHLVGKQTHLPVPCALNPTYPSQWQALCHSTVRARNGVVGVRLRYTRYLGDPKDLTTQDRKDIANGVQRYIDVPVSITTKAVNMTQGTSIRTMIDKAYPSAVTLADIAAASSVVIGAYVAPAARALPATSTSTWNLARVVGGRRGTRATWSPPTHHLLPSRTQMHLQQGPPRMAPPRPHQPQAFFVITHNDIPELSGPGAIGFQPKSVAEALAHASAPLWRAAINKEMAGLVARGTWVEVHISTLPRGTNIMPTTMVLKDKPGTGAKARLVVRGDLQNPKPHPNETYAGTPSSTSFRTFVSVATQQGWGMDTIDVSQAFIQSDELPTDAGLYIYPPQGYACAPGTVLRLRRPLYGLAMAPRAWSITLQHFLTSYGFKAINGSDTQYNWHDATSTRSMHLLYHVDDILVAFSHAQDVADFKRAMLARFDAVDSGPVSTYVGIDIARTSTTTTISQEVLTLNLLDLHNMRNCKAVDTPMAPDSTLLNSDRAAHPDPVKRAAYQQLVGSLQYLATWTRPDLAYCTNQLAAHMIAPGPVHEAAAHRVLRYLKGTSALGITYTKGLQQPNTLKSWADANWYLCEDTHRAISGRLTVLNGGAVAWKSKRQSSVAANMEEACYVATSLCSDELLWFSRLLGSYDINVSDPINLYGNMHIHAPSLQQVSHVRSKHIDVRVHNLQQRVDLGVVKRQQQQPDHRLASTLTHNLGPSEFARYTDAQMGRGSFAGPWRETQMSTPPLIHHHGQTFAQQPATARCSTDAVSTQQ